VGARVGVAVGTGRVEVETSEVSETSEVWVAGAVQAARRIIGIENQMIFENMANLLAKDLLDNLLRPKNNICRKFQRAAIFVSRDLFNNTWIT
jgi:hypothetical protein